MSPAAKKGLKIGGIILLVFIAIYIIYYFMKGGSSGGWTAKPKCDIAGGDLETVNRAVPIEEAKAHANDIGAKAILINSDSNMTYYKSSGTGFTCGGSGNYTLYIKS
jgi:hypothetical protein